MMQLYSFGCEDVGQDSLARHSKLSQPCMARHVNHVYSAYSGLHSVPCEMRVPISIDEYQEGRRAERPAWTAPLGAVTPMHIDMFIRLYLPVITWVV